MEAAWSMSTRLAKHITPEDLQSASESPLGNFATPILKLKGDATQNYDSVCLPLTSTSWKERWRDMCTTHHTLDDSKNKANERRAEDWRANPGFVLGEVHMTRLGTLSMY